MFDLGKLINKITENYNSFDIKPGRDWDTSGKRFGSTVKSKQKLQFSSHIDIKTGLTKTIDWTKKNKLLIQSNIDRQNKMLNYFEE